MGGWQEKRGSAPAFGLPGIFRVTGNGGVEARDRAFCGGALRLGRHEKAAPKGGFSVKRRLDYMPSADFTCVMTDGISALF